MNEKHKKLEQEQKEWLKQSRNHPNSCQRGQSELLMTKSWSHGTLGANKSLMMNI
jgi:hypothetical protein